MGFKLEQKDRTFSNLEKSSTGKKNRSKETLINMEKAISWNKIESILLKDYSVGDKKEGNKAYPPLMLFKCLLIPKWFLIKSDPELESQINDRDSFQTFLGLSSNEGSPDHSTFSISNHLQCHLAFDILVEISRFFLIEFLVTLNGRGVWESRAGDQW